jgi:hypothetical protein
VPKRKLIIHRRRLNKVALAAVPNHERNFFLEAAHVVNELNSLQKLAIWSMRRSENPHVEVAQVCQTLLLLRLLVGKLNEAHELVRTAYNATHLSREYDSGLSTQAKNSAREINRYFGRSNLIHEVRNVVAFHYSAKAMDGALQQITPDEDLEYFVAERLPNTLYVFSEALVTRSMLGAKGLTGFERFMDEVIRVSGWFLRFLDGFIEAFIARHGKEVFDDGGGENFEVSMTEKFEDVVVPWFTEVVAP